MNPGNIWWGQIGNSLRLLNRVTNSLRDCCSTVLQVTGTLPWQQDFYQAIVTRCNALGSQRRLVRHQWAPDMEPGEFVLDKLCSDRVKAEYWPGKSYAEYLGTKEELMLNDYYVWINGIHDKRDLEHWVYFVSEYHHAAQNLDSFAVFVLEYDGEEAEVDGVENIVYRVEDYDCRVFALEAAAALTNTNLRNYQAELALNISGCDPELSFALLNTGKSLLHEPIKTAREVLEECCNSQGQFFSDCSAWEIHSAAWEAAIVLLFPILERYRMAFIAKHSEQLARHLPISNSNGDHITDPWDLELGPLHYIVSNETKKFDLWDAERIRLCRKVRNLLAHNKLVPYEDAKKIFALEDTV